MLADALLQLNQLDADSGLGTLRSLGRRMREEGRVLQDKAEDWLRDHGGDASAETGVKRSTDWLLAKYLQLRGIGYEGEGLLTETLGTVKAAGRNIPGRLIAIGKELAKSEPTDFDDVTRAHALKIQSMIVMGRFFQRVPRPYRDLERAERWLRSSIEESPKNPERERKGLPEIHPVLPRLYLVEVLEESGRKADAKAVLQEARDLFSKELSDFEKHLKKFLEVELRKH